MSLHQYEIDFSSLSIDERKSIIHKIEQVSHDGLHWKQGLQSAVFSVETNRDINFLNIPEACHLTQIL